MVRQYKLTGRPGGVQNDRFQNSFCEQPETRYSHRQPPRPAKHATFVFVATAILTTQAGPSTGLTAQKITSPPSSREGSQFAKAALSFTSCCTASWAHRKGGFLAEDGLCAIGTLSFQSSTRTSWRFRGDRNLEYRGERKLFCNRSATPRWQIGGRSDPTRRSDSSPPLRSRYTRRHHRRHAPPEEPTCVS